MPHLRRIFWSQRDPDHVCLVLSLLLTGLPKHHRNIVQFSGASFRYQRPSLKPTPGVPNLAGLTDLTLRQVGFCEEEDVGDCRGSRALGFTERRNLLGNLQQPRSEISDFW